MHLSFNANTVRRFIAMSKASTRRRPTLGQLHDTGLWRDDMDPGRRRVLLGELEADGFSPSLTEADIDPAKIPAGIWLVGDQGVYIMSNIPIEESRSQGLTHVAYADEANPETLPFETWWDAKRASFGGDDGVEFIAASDLAAALSDIGAQLVIDLTPERMSILGAPRRAP